jgi:DNA replication factor GINS
MNLDDLKVIRSNERSSRKLTQLKPDFYVDVKAYIDSLRERKDQKKKDELVNTLSVIEAIYDKRVAKIIRLASLRAKGHVEDAPLTDEELKIYDGIYQLFTVYRDLMLGMGESGEVSSNDTDGLTKDKLTSDNFERISDSVPFEDTAMNVKEKQTIQLGIAAVSEEGDDFICGAPVGDELEIEDTRTLIQESKNIKYVIVRILADIPTFIGLDGRNYKLSKEDVVALPEGNAKTLCNRNLAIRTGDLS